MFVQSIIVIIIVVIIIIITDFGFYLESNIYFLLFKLRFMVLRYNIEMIDYINISYSTLY